MNIRDYQRTGNDFDSLSFKDLMDARDLYHVHLLNHPRVVATAVGRYRIRSRDPWPDGTDTGNGKGKAKGKDRRTLSNSEVRPYSWPAILVFVDEWIDAADFAEGARYRPDEMVPRTLFLADGRKVPVCVIAVEKIAGALPVAEEVRYPLNNIGGGHPVVTEVQGRQRLATLTCLVTDGHRTYALTNRHVAGEAGQILHSILDGEQVPIGSASDKQLTRLPFTEIYPEWSGKKQYLNLDAGLVDIDNLDDWTAQIQGLPTIGPLMDLSVASVSLSLIGCNVVGVGAASGQMLGEITAFYYRYKSIGGFEYVADFLIGPRPSPQSKVSAKKVALAPALLTRAGDSGALWLLDPREAKPRAEGADPLEFRPFAMQWGAQLLNEGGATTYALATSLSTVFDRLELDIVRDWNLDQVDTWGAVGHFSVAASAAACLTNNALKKLMKLNAEIISAPGDEIASSEFKGMGTADFVPLADVPDMYWKPRIAKQGFARAMEGPNHFADMDQPRESDGKTLLDLTTDDDFIDPDKWNEFYESIADILSGESIEMKHRGLLPFRVWQIFNDLVRFAKSGETDKFVCAAGVLTHYLGDACQPLHISYLHDGDPERPVTTVVNHVKTGPEDVVIPLGKGVHGAYEDKMVSDHRSEILAALAQTPSVKAIELIGTGKEAAKATIAMMRSVFKRLPPREIVEFYINSDAKPKQLSIDMWEAFGDATVKCMKSGTHLIAVLWQSAWELGTTSRTVSAAEIRALRPDEAMQICQDANFLASLPVSKIAAELRRPF